MKSTRDTKQQLTTSGYGCWRVNAPQSLDGAKNSGLFCSHAKSRPPRSLCAPRVRSGLNVHPGQQSSSLPQSMPFLSSGGSRTTPIKQAPLSLPRSIRMNTQRSRDSGTRLRTASIPLRPGSSMSWQRPSRAGLHDSPLPRRPGPACRAGWRQGCRANKARSKAYKPAIELITSFSINGCVIACATPSWAKSVFPGAALKRPRRSSGKRSSPVTRADLDDPVRPGWNTPPISTAAWAS